MQRVIGHVRAVDGVSFNIKRSQTFGLVGESGSGKTTVGRTLLRLTEPTAGKSIIDGKDIFAMKKQELRKLRPKMQIIFQDPYSSLDPRLTIGQIIGEAVREHKLVPKSELRDYVLEVMKNCELRPYQHDRYPHEFSGGQRQRICIARALALNPDVVVADEPVSALDVSVQAQIINLMRDLQTKRHLSYLFISHDLSVVEYISDVVGVMYLGSLVEMAPKAEFF
ncbi:transport atp-binding protein [Holotrichia oblita]|nr:transport atp-binding protein [Holotrichia oblita]